MVHRSYERGFAGLSACREELGKSGGHFAIFGAVVKKVAQLRFEAEFVLRVRQLRVTEQQAAVQRFQAKAAGRYPIRLKVLPKKGSAVGLEELEEVALFNVSCLQCTGGVPFENVRVDLPVGRQQPHVAATSFDGRKARERSLQRMEADAKIRGSRSRRRGWPERRRDARSLGFVIGDGEEVLQHGASTAQRAPVQRAVEAVANVETAQYANGERRLHDAAIAGPMAYSCRVSGRRSPVTEKPWRSIREEHDVPS
ncbi:MAG: hypothetical protein ACYDG0_03730 [Vulcanimicrobiaceae bacterium]